MSSSISRVIFNKKCPACKKLYTRHHRSCGTQSHRRNRNNKVADGLQSDDLSTPSGSSPRFDGTHEADYQPHGGSDSVLVGERGDNIRPPAGKLIEIRSSSSPGTHGGTAACQTVARAASIPYDKGGPLSRVPSDGLGLGLLDWRFIVTILPADQPSTCVWNRHRLSQHLLEASHDASLLLSDKQKAAELANKLVDRNDYQLQAKVIYRCSVLLRLKGDIKGSEGIIRSFFSMASSVIDTVAEEDFARLYLSQANNYAYHLMFENAHEEMRRVRSWVRHEESSCSGSTYSALAELCGETGILWAAELSEKKPDAAPVDMDGVMNAAQLEAFQLLQEIERERRSKGRRGTKKDGQEDEE